MTDKNIKPKDRYYMSQMGFNDINLEIIPDEHKPKYLPQRRAMNYLGMAVAISVFYLVYRYWF